MKTDRGPVIVSACLLGIKCRYDGTEATDPVVLDLASSVHAVPVCPEQLGGLATPRPRAEISPSDDFADPGGDLTGADVLACAARVLDEYGTDITKSFVDGARAVAELARITGATEAWLKEKSPSCGVELIYWRGQVVKGSGVTTALLKGRGLVVKGF